ncbi:MAG TPA: pitrilysin family protein [Gemmatimonadaceae bacterium]|nr:pitrilysin family protein [Gemmatimonadaceae bacterium]
MTHRPLYAALMVATAFVSGQSAMAQGKSAAPTATASRDILPFKAVERTLPNGLKVIIVPTGFPNIVSLQIPVQTGSRNEVEPGKSGFAHFFEHVMFRGTKTATQEDMSRILTKAGARENAYTTDDFTNYYITFAKEDLEGMLKLQADRFQNLSYTEPVFKTEARAVLGEYNKNSANPGSKLFEVMRDSAFSKHTYKHTTMGFIKDIEDMPNQFEYSKVFFDRWYRPENTTIIVAGDVSADDVMPLVQKYWGDWKRGNFKATIPAEPPPTGPKYAHVQWPSSTLPYLAVAFRNPAFSETSNDNAALDFVANLFFGSTSELYKKLVQREQKVDGLSASNTSNADPELFTIFARVKKPEDVAYVRDEILKAVAAARATTVSAAQLAEAKSNTRYSFVRSLDNTDRIASTLARFVRYNRSFGTINKAYALYDALTPADLRRAARTYFTDNGMIVTTLSSAPLAADVRTLPRIATFESAIGSQGVASNGNGNGSPMADPKARYAALVSASSAAAAVPATSVIVQKTPLPQIRMKLLFNVGSAYDPAGKEGLAALSAAMITGAGSRTLTLEQITKALYPMAGSFGSQVDKEMTTLTASVHRDNWPRFLGITLPQILEPAFREEDFKRNKDAFLNGLKQDLRSNNEEELGRERLQTNIFQGTGYAHPVIGTVAGLESITLDDVRNFVRNQYTRGNLVIGINGDVSPQMVSDLRTALGALPAGSPAAARSKLAGVRPKGMEVEIIEKDTRATAISFGLPIEVTRTHPDFAALSVARAWLGEHRMSTGRLYDRIRGIRGINYGDYAYIEAFPRGMFQFFPDANIARRAQIFEIWIRPVVPENAHMTLRIATHELDNLITNGLSEQDFQAAREYLMKNVYVMTATQDQQVGYALDSRWYGMPDFTTHMRAALQKLTRDDVNRAIKQHLSAKDLSVVMITKDAKQLRDALLADAPSPIKYDGEKPQSLLDEDKVIGARKLNLTPDRVRITPVEEVFAK